MGSLVAAIRADKCVLPEHPRRQGVDMKTGELWQIDCTAEYPINRVYNLGNAADKAPFQVMVGEVKEHDFVIVLNPTIHKKWLMSFIECLTPIGRGFVNVDMLIRHHG